MLLFHIIYWMCAVPAQVSFLREAFQTCHRLGQVTLFCALITLGPSIGRHTTSSICVPSVLLSITRKGFDLCLFESRRNCGLSLNCPQKGSQGGDLVLLVTTVSFSDVLRFPSWSPHLCHGLVSVSMSPLKLALLTFFSLLRISTVLFRLLTFNSALALKCPAISITYPPSPAPNHWTPGKFCHLPPGLWGGLGLGSHQGFLVAMHEAEEGLKIVCTLASWTRVVGATLPFASQPASVKADLFHTSFPAAQL